MYARFISLLLIGIHNFGNITYPDPGIEILCSSRAPPPPSLIHIASSSIGIDPL